MLSLTMTVPYTWIGKPISEEATLTDKKFTAPDSLKWSVSITLWGESVNCIGPMGAVHIPFMLGNKGY
jgi:hypothetical protein